jgi:predicted MFS family arabinose efflux permease
MSEPGVGKGLTLVLAVGSGTAVANAYAAQPLLGLIGPDLGVVPATAALITGVVQIGYLLGLLFLVPLGDAVDRRRLIVGHYLLAAAALTVAGLTPHFTVFLLANVVAGVGSAVVQLNVAYAAALSVPTQRGRIVGRVTSGVVVGILLARTVAGALGDAVGWRATYLVSAVLTLALGCVLARLLPADRANRPGLTYRQLVGGVFVLTRREPVFRSSSLIGLGLFAAFGAVWGPLALPLAAEPWRLSSTEIGLFGLAGILGVLGAAHAGALADRGHAAAVTTGGLLLLVGSWVLIAQAPHSLVLLAVGLMLLDLAGQAVHVTNQNRIVSLDPARSSRLISGYMLFYSLGIGGGSAAASSVYQTGGWAAVSGLGAALSAAALLAWIVARQFSPVRSGSDSTRSGRAS